jgi:crotonobetainyl-CoA:carnitine CoA-transferase CaiB-like acyl-CoA transferase
VVNLPIDVMKKLRLDYDSLKAIKPDVILVMASAFGPDGPYRDRVGFDGVAQAMSGAMELTGFEAPTRSVVSWADYGTALHAAFGAMAALYHRAQTGQGQLIDVSLLATSVTFMNAFLLEYNQFGIRRERRGNAAFYMAPSDAYQTRDGWILVPTIGDAMFRRWTRLVEREDLLDDPCCRDDGTRAANRELIGQIMSKWCEARTRDEAVAALEKARIPCGPVYGPNEVAGDPQVAARGLFESVPYSGSSKPLSLTNPALRLSETPGDIRRPPPRLGEHTDEILAELGFSEAERARFREALVV